MNTVTGQAQPQTVANRHRRPRGDAHDPVAEDARHLLLVNIRGGVHAAGVDVEVQELLGAERLDELGVDSEASAVRAPSASGEVLRADADDDLPVGVGAQAGPLRDDLRRQRERLRTEPQRARGRG